MTLPPKRPSHHTFPRETEISRFDRMRVFDGDEAWVRELEESIFCMCPAPAKRLIQYKVFVNDLHDLVMRGLSRVPHHRYALCGDGRGSGEGEADQGGGAGAEEGVKGDRS